MEERYGVLREKLDIKILLLFILRRLPGICSAETLAELVMRDAGVGYFEYAECLGELEDAGHVKRQLGGFQITEKGDRNCAIVESSLPYTIRSRLSRLMEPIAEDMRRQALITAEHQQDEDGCRVHLAVSDGVGQILDLTLLCAGDKQAELIEKNFRDNAEEYYNQIMELLSRAE